MGKLSAGYVFDFLVHPRARIGVGAYWSLPPIDAELEFVYGKTPWSFGIFFRFTIA